MQPAAVLEKRYQRKGSRFGDVLCASGEGAPARFSTERVEGDVPSPRNDAANINVIEYSAGTLVGQSGKMDYRLRSSIRRSVAHARLNFTPIRSAEVGGNETRLQRSRIRGVHLNRRPLQFTGEEHRRHIERRLRGFVAQDDGRAIERVGSAGVESEGTKTAGQLDDAAGFGGAESSSKTRRAWHWAPPSCDAW